MLFYDKLKNYLLFEHKNRKTAKTTKDGIVNDTIEKYLKNFKTFLAWSQERNYHDNSFYLKSGFKTAIKKKDAKTEKRNIISYLYELALKKTFEYYNK